MHVYVILLYILYSVTKLLIKTLSDPVRWNFWRWSSCIDKFNTTL